MLYTVEEDVELCKEFKINPAQLFFVKMLVKDPSYEDSEWRKKSYRMSMEYQNVIGGLSEEDLIDLVVRDIIVDHNDYGKNLFDYYEINPKFANRFRLKVYPMPAELFDNYPKEFEAGGRKFLAKNAGPEEIAKDYLRAINNDPEEHKMVLEDLKWGKNNKVIVVGLKKFVQTKYWELLRDKRKFHVKKNSDVTIR